MSDYDLSQMGAYQFRNLVRSGVPFFLIHEAGDFLKYFSVTEKISLNRWAFPLNFEGPFDDLWIDMADRGVAKEMPIVLLGLQEGRSQQLKLALETQQFQQVFEVRDGWRGLQTEEPSV